MIIEGVEVSKEYLETSNRLAKAIMEVTKVVHPDPSLAAMVIAGCGLGALLDFTGGDVAKVKKMASDMIDSIAKSIPKIERAINGPDLQVVNNAEEDNTQG